MLEKLKERGFYQQSTHPEEMAQRLAFSILRYTPEEIHNLTDALSEVKEKISFCSVCSGFTDTDPCAICTNSGRDQKQLCVVEQPNNIFPIENSGA